MTLDIRTASLDQLDENPWNPNQQDDRTFEAEIESIERFGFIDPITVRTHPDDPERFQIVDGAHRFRALKALAHEGDVPIIVIDVTEDEAKLLTIILNETRGQPDRIDLAMLLADVSERMGPDVGIGLPYTEEELDGLLKLATFDFSQYGKVEPEPEVAEDDWVSIIMRVPAPVFDLWKQTRKTIESKVDIKPHDDDRIRSGIAFELMLADWASGQ